MKNQNSVPFFSIVMPTRDRPELFKLALDSVVSQEYDNYEIHVVNDGSSGEYLELYRELEKEYEENVIFHYLTYRPNGHGQSYSMNYGAYHSKGKYVCFLDDDDFWIDNEHLTRAAGSLNNSVETVDLYYTNQKAFFSDGKQNTDKLWIEDLQRYVDDIATDSYGSYGIEKSVLLKINGFAHLNCSIFLKDLYDKINGMDEHIRYECDRDIYIRALDSSKHILYNPAFISKHHIPDPKKANNMSTMISVYEKKIFQLRVYDKGILASKEPEIIELCKKGMGYELKYITEALESEKKYDLAFYYARKALATNASIKWFFYTILLFIKSKTN